MASAPPQPPQPPPPPYSETVEKSSSYNKKARYGATYTGPSWLYSYPQATPPSSPYLSLRGSSVDDVVLGAAQHPGGGTVPVALAIDLGEDPVQLTCPYCQQVVVTVTEQEVGFLAYILSACLCLVGCWPCAFLPCCISDLLDVSHSCPNCRRYLHTFKRGV